MSGPYFNPRGYKPTHITDTDTELSSSTTIRYKRHGAASLAEWPLEALTSVGSLAFLAGIVVIFLKMDNKPLSAWNSAVSLNAVISILTTACSTALMHGVSNFISQLKWLHFKNGPQRLADLEKFDEASRGPWGCLKFLATSRLNLATIGALVTIARFAFAPLVQQVVMIEQRITPEAAATFGYAHEYNRGVLVQNSVDQSIPQDAGMQAAVIQGLYNINSPDMFNCSGACRWEGQFITLGFKSQCSNVTEATLQSLHCNKTSNGVITYCNMTTPGGLGVSTRRVDTDYSTSYWMNVSTPRNITEAKARFPEIGRFALYRSTSDINFQPLDINITDCSLSFTAYEYTNAQANGSAFSFGQTREVDFGATIPWEAWGDGLRGGLRTNQSEAKGTPTLAVSWNDLRALQVFLESSAIVSEWVDGNWVNKNFGLSGALAGDVDVGQRFGKLALAMTSYLRSGPNSILAHGQSLKSEAFVSIRWLYLVGPIAIELLALLFAVFTVVSNRKSRNVPLWKASALAVLACRYDDKSEKIQTKFNDITENMRTAKETFAQLE
ncbi:hypothetical protein MauCBS54593_003592 [Microsporum audouinii]